MGGRMMEKLRGLVAQEPVIAASCLIATIGVSLPLFVKPLLDASSSSSSSNKHTDQRRFSDILVAVTGPSDK
uniref:Uncharacterized protein n=1 Tax=Chenopodium quinoa TaxID=63459 RepID=A0A803LN83_CHEQI